MAYVSVIIPAFNASRYIDDCLSSLIRQSFSDFEVLVCDDCSSDETVAIIENYRRIDSRIQCVPLSHMGAGAARNEGIRQARGEYLYFLDADDYIEDDFLEKVVHAADEYQADIVVVKSHFLDDISKYEWPIDYAVQDVPFDTLMMDATLPANPFQSFVGWPWDKLFRSNFVRDNGLEFQELRSTNDARFVFLALCLAKRVICLDYDGVAHRTNNKHSLEHTRSKSWDNAIRAMESIYDCIQSDAYSDQQRNSFANWVAHFSYWSMSTLDGESLTEDVVAAFDRLLSSINFDNVDFNSTDDREFAQLSRSSRAGVILSYILQRSRFEAVVDRQYREEKELRANLDHMTCRLTELEAANQSLARQVEAADRRYEEMYMSLKASYSYRLGNFLIKPLSFLKAKIKGSSHC